MSAATPLLAIRGLRAAYGRIEALKGVDLEIKTGEIVALIGANGAGKSTLMMSIFGKPRARAGHITFDGQDITGLPTHHIARLRIAQSPEGRRIFARMSVAENAHHERRFTGAIGADQRDDLAGLDIEIDALQRLDPAVGGAQAANGEQRRGGGAHVPPSITAMAVSSSAPR